MLKADVSANANFGLWQLAQLTVESLESIFSENNFLPKAALVVISTLPVLKEKLRRSKKLKMNKVFNIFFPQQPQPPTLMAGKPFILNS